MSVGNTRFLESNGALPFSLVYSIPSIAQPTAPLSPYLSPSRSILLPGELLHAIYYGLYVHTCAESKAHVFGTTSTYHGVYVPTYREDVRHISHKDLLGMTSPAAYSFVLDIATPTERQMVR